MAQELLRAEMQRRRFPADVISAGFLQAGVPADKKVVWAMRRLGFDLTNHFSENIVKALERDPDLVLTMAGEHLRLLSECNPRAARRAFTLKEFVRLAGVEGARGSNEPIFAYLDRVRVGRSISPFGSAKADYDVQDPIGKRRSVFASCASELQVLVRQTADFLYPMTE